MGLLSKSDDGKIEVEIGEGRLNEIKRGLGSGDTNQYNLDDCPFAPNNCPNGSHGAPTIRGGD